MFTVHTNKMNSTDQPLTIDDVPVSIAVFEQRDGNTMVIAAIVIEPGTIDVYGPDDHFLGTWHRTTPEGLAAAAAAAEQHDHDHVHDHSHADA